MGSNATTERITRNPAVLGGKPIVRGTRISVELINSWVAAGHTPEEIIDDYPELTETDIQATVAYAKAERERTEVRTG